MMVAQLRDNLHRATGNLIRTRQATVGIVGLGYVGLPMLLEAKRQGFDLVGVDTDVVKLLALNEGRSYVGDVSDEQLGKLKARFVANPKEAPAHVWVIAVPTPLEDGHAHLGFVLQAAQAVGLALRPGDLVCLESTTYPGTTREKVLPILQEYSGGMTAGKEFFLAYSPERIDPGSGVPLRTIPKLVAGLTTECLGLAVEFYGSLFKTVVPVSGLEEAEMAKLLENTYRQVNIALVNQLATAARTLDVDILEAIRAASTKPFGFMPFYPGPGVGGHCISIDPMFLADRARQKSGFSLSLIEAANEVNTRMPEYVYLRLAELLNDHGKAVRGSKVLIAGIAYKPGVADTREAPAVELMNRLHGRGAALSYSDPLVPDYGRWSSVALDQETVKAFDAVVLITPQPGMDLDLLVENSKLLLDTRGILPNEKGVQRL